MGRWVEHTVGRRWILTQTGRGVLGVAVLGMAACSGESEPPGGSAATPSTTRTPTPSDSPSAPSSQPAGELAWSRVDLGFVSAYVLVRGNEAAIVDTGTGGSAGEIGSVLQGAGVGWDRVRHVVLTHKHGDHAGSISDVLAEATQATGYAGAADLAEIDSELSPLEDGDDVFGLRVVATPGHTAGHLAVFDSATGVLVAGDALNNDGGLTGANPRFTEDQGAAAESVRKLARLTPSTILVGHGAPVIEDAAAALQQLASTLE